MKNFTFLLVFSLSTMGYCQSELALEVMGTLESDTVKWNDELIVEKVDPNNTDESILVLPVILEEDESSFWLKTWIVRINNKAGVILNSVCMLDDSDAIQLSRYEIDTAPYQVTSEKRAFGIRTVYHGSSQANPYTTEKLTLFITDQNALKKVLEDFEMHLFIGEWDGTCDGKFTHHKKILIIQSTSTNGYFDILVKTKVSVETTFYDEFNDCDSTTSSSSEKSTLRFVQGIYREIRD